MARIKTWQQKNGIEIDEVEFDGDAHAFEMSVNGKHVVTIYTYTRESTEDRRVRLDAGEDVRDWWDCNGNSVWTLIKQRTGDGLRETLKRLEDAGTCYNGRLDNGKHGTIWVDKVIGAYYEYETDDLDLGVDDLTDEDLENVIIGGL